MLYRVYTASPPRVRTRKDVSDSNWFDDIKRIVKTWQRWKDDDENSHPRLLTHASLDLELWSPICCPTLVPLVSFFAGLGCLLHRFFFSDILLGWGGLRPVLLSDQYFLALIFCSSPFLLHLFIRMACFFSGFIFILHSWVCLSQPLCMLLSLLGYLSA